MYALTKFDDGHEIVESIQRLEYAEDGKFVGDDALFTGGIEIDGPASIHLMSETGKILATYDI